MKASIAGVGMPILGALGSASSPVTVEPTTGGGSPYEGPYKTAPRNVTYPYLPDSSEYLYFTPTNPYPAVGPIGDRRAFASGGVVNSGDGHRPLNMSRGSFVVDARTVSEIGNGSSNAGLEVLAKLGGVPITGGGDGVSDSIRAVIDGRIPAKVARDEVYFSADAVKKIGGGNAGRGAQRLYALMEQAQEVRKKVQRGNSSGLAGIIR